jgi:hypothetical protein
MTASADNATDEPMQPGADLGVDRENGENRALRALPVILGILLCQVRLYPNLMSEKAAASRQNRVGIVIT